MLKFNNINLPSYVKINDFRQSLIPSISQNTIKINGKPGLIDFGNEIAERKIEFDFTIQGASLSDLQDKIRSFSQWLYYEEDKQLIVLTESDKYYNAKVSQDSEITIDGTPYNTASGTIIFICSDPYVYGTTKNFSFNPTTTDPINFTNSGGTDVFPKIRMTFNENVCNFSLAADNEYLRFGTPLKIGETTTFNSRPVVMEEYFSTLSGWSSASSVDDGIITGEFSSNGSSISPSTWGTGTRWHGPALIKALNNSVQDFYLRCRFGNYATKIGQLGRVEVYLLDALNNVIGKIALRNGNPNAITPFLQVRLGSNYILQTYGSYQGVWRNFKDGFMDIERIGNKWRFYCAIYDTATQTDHTRLNFNYVDVDNQYMTQVARIQIHIGAFGTAYAPTSIYMTHLRVNEILEVPSPSTQNECIFHTGDVLEIDNEKGAIYLNGAPYYSSLDPGSRFIKFKTGSNGLSVSPVSISSGSVSFVERWL